ncbi:hypothetical protein R6Q59_031740 [Mikania micrantha]
MFMWFVNVSTELLKFIIQPPCLFIYLFLICKFFVNVMLLMILHTLNKELGVIHRLTMSQEYHKVIMRPLMKGPSALWHASVANLWHELEIGKSTFYQIIYHR